MNNYKILKRFDRKSIFTGKWTHYVTIEIPNETVKVKNILLKVNHIYEALDPKIYGNVKNYWDPINDSNVNVRRDFNIYRKRQRLMMPIVIKHLRKDVYNLSQRELAVVLGLGYATISKIEDNKIIQSVSQDSALRILLNSNEMVDLINNRSPIAKESSSVNVDNIKRKTSTSLKDINLRCVNRMAKVIRRHILGDVDDLSNPDDINNRIKDAIGAKVIYTNEPKVDGAIKWDKDTNHPEIFLAKNESPLRQRFTIAHELGHFSMHRGYFNDKNQTTSMDDSFGVMYRGYPGTAGSYKEEQANEFAADFLMPDSGIKKLYKNAVNKDPDYLKVDISKRYKVSEEAAYRRLINLRNRHVL